MLRTTASCWIVLVVLALGITTPVLAQETEAAPALEATSAEDICIAGGIVARIRTASPYTSLKKRAAAIDQRIAEVISTQDTQNPQVSVQEVDGVWHVFAGPVKVIGVQPPEAEANGIAARQLAAIWANNIKERLPLATPVSRMPAEAAGAQLSTAPSPPAEPEEAAPAPPAEAQPAPSVGEAAPVEVEEIPRSAALLLIVDAFNVIRNLSEEDYLDKREEVASNLIKNIRPFVALPEPEEAPKVPQVPAPITSRPQVGPPVFPRPVEVEEAPAPAEGEAPALSLEAAPTYIPVPGITATTGIPEGHEDDPAYTKVPQKHRIKAKFQYTRVPYQQLATEDPQTAQAVGELLRAARMAFAAGNFHDCETYLDHALTLLGAVPLPKEPLSE